MPGEQDAQVAHLGTIEVRGNQREIRGLSIRAVITNRHVKKGPGHVTHRRSGGLEGIGIDRPVCCRAGRLADVEEQGGAVVIDLIIRGEEVVQVGVIGPLVVGISA